MISVQHEDFSIQAEYEALRDSEGKTGAICFFVGLVRDFGDRHDLTGMYLEHYPGMTEKALQKIVDEAHARWPILKTRIIHRVGNLDINDQIVYVGVSSAHREAAFAACEFIMDYLKTRAPFWKKERCANNDQWVEEKNTDQNRADRWR